MRLKFVFVELAVSQRRFIKADTFLCLLLFFCCFCGSNVSHTNRHPSMHQCWVGKKEMEGSDLRSLLTSAVGDVHSRSETTTKRSGPHANVTPTTTLTTRGAKHVAEVADKIFLGGTSALIRQSCVRQQRCASAVYRIEPKLTHGSVKLWIRGSLFK